MGAPASQRITFPRSSSALAPPQRCEPLPLPLPHRSDVRNRWQFALELSVRSLEAHAMSVLPAEKQHGHLEVSAIQFRAPYGSLWRTASVAASIAARRTNSDQVKPKRCAARRTSNALSGSSLIEIIAPSWGDATSGSDSLAQPCSSHSFSLMIGVNGSDTDLIARLAMVAPRSLLLILEAFPLYIGRQPSRNRSPDAGVVPRGFSKDHGDENTGWRSPDKKPVLRRVPLIVAEGEPISAFNEILNEPGVDVRLDMALVVLVSHSKSKT
jgi:hypothetical protein